MRFVYDNPRQVLGEYNPVDYIAQISPTPLLLPARNDALTPAAFAIAAYEKALEPKRPEILPGGHFDAYVQRLRRLKPASAGQRTRGPGADTSVVRQPDVTIRSWEGKPAVGGRWPQ